MPHFRAHHDFSTTDRTQVIPSPPSRIYERFGKRALDISLIIFAAPVVLLILGVMCILGAMDGASPIYTQRRLGKNNKVFRLYKLRSMVTNSNKVLQDILKNDPEAAAYWAKHQKLRPDPRVTFVGRISRKTSFDELPQLWNVLRGDMSLVGPRPMTPEQKDMYPGHHYAKQLPGLTGPWQISERASSSFADRAAYDTAYYENMSFTYDLKIILKTFSVVLTCKGE